MKNLFQKIWFKEEDAVSFRKESKDERKAITKRINEVLTELDYHSPSDDEYRKILENINRLYDLRNKRIIDPDVVVQVSGTVLMVLMVLAFERDNVISTKAFQFIRGKF